MGARLTLPQLWGLTAAILVGTAALSGTLQSWLAAVAVLALAVGPGLLLVRVCVGTPAPALVALALGLAGLSLVGFAALVTGTASLWLFVGVSIASWAGYAALGPLPTTRARADPSPRLTGRERAAVGLLWALLALLMFQASVPDCCFDPVWAHLPLAEAIAEQRYQGIPDVWWTTIPLAYHLLAAVAYILDGGMAAKLLHSAFLLMTTGWAVWFGVRLQGRLAGLAAGALFLTIPLVLWDGTVGNTDMGAAFFSVAAIAAFFEFLRQGGAGWLFITGTLVGTAMAIKLFAAALLLPLGLVLLRERIRQRAVPGLMFGCLLLVAGVAITAGVWLARTAVLTGNPLFPASSQYFRSPYGQTAAEIGPPLPMGPPWTIRFPWTVRRVLALPWLLTFKPSELGPTPDGAMGSYPLLWLPLLVVGWSALGRIERDLLLIAAGNFVAISVFAPDPRYQLTSWLLLAVVLGGVLARSPLLGGWHRGVTRRFVPVILLGGLAYSLVAWLAFFPARASLDFLTRTIDRPAFLRRTVPGLDAFEDVQRLVPPDEKIIADGLYATWYVKRYLLLAGLPPVRPLFTKPDLSRAEAVALLGRHGLRYFLAPTTGRYRLLELGIARPLVSRGGFTLYELAAS